MRYPLLLAENVEFDEGSVLLDEGGTRILLPVDD